MWCVVCGVCVCVCVNIKFIIIGPDTPPAQFNSIPNVFDVSFMWEEPVVPNGYHNILYHHYHQH